MGRFLVVDDDPSSRAMLGLSLRRAGHTVVVAADGDDALEHLRNSAFDALLTDLAMEPMDGLELARRARTVQPGLRVVVVSAVTRPESDALADAVFSKPVQLDSLLRWLRP